MSKFAFLRFSAYRWKKVKGMSWNVTIRVNDVGIYLGEYRGIKAAERARMRGIDGYY